MSYQGRGGGGLWPARTRSGEAARNSTSPWARPWTVDWPLWFFAACPEVWYGWWQPVIWKIASGDYFAVNEVHWMKRRLPPAKSPLPKFQSDQAAAEYFETHSVADVWKSLSESKAGKLSKPLAETIRKRHVAAKSPISIRLGAEQIAAAKKIAAAKSVGIRRN
jgi:hypothetical protein